MAEARSIAHLTDIKRGVNLHSIVDERGVHLHLDLTIPPPRKWGRIIQQHAHAAARTIRYSIFPFGLPIFLIVVSVVVAGVTSAERDSWWRNGWLAEGIWAIGEFFPWLDVSLEVKVAILACWAGVLGFIILTALQRMLLRLLLSYKGFLWHSRGAPFYVKLWSMAVYVLGGAGMRHLLYAFQSVLPSLPVPLLEQTVQQYLDSVRPIMTPEEFAAHEEEAREFLAGPGPRLQWYLNLKSWISSNYVTDWWEQYVYLKGRLPIMINSNYYIQDSGRRRPTSSQTSRAAVLTHQFCRYMRDVEEETLEPLVKNGIPLCMEQVRRIFGTTRIPGRDIDQIVHYDSSHSRHVAVLCKGSFYKLPVFHRGADSLMTPQELERALDEIVEDASTRSAPGHHEASIAALTAINRTRWAEAREEHFSEGTNRRSLGTIESALFFLSLDDDESEELDWTSRGQALIHGDCTNRWFDKSITLVVFKNGKAGLNCEHAWADAPIAAHMLEVCMLVPESRAASPYHPKTGRILEDYGFDSRTAMCERPSTAKWERLEWRLSRLAEASIDDALRSARALADDLELVVRPFSEYGKGFMKKCRVSPDAYIQMAMQLAYFRDQGHFDATYEASMTRFYRLGRTETIRSCSDKSCHFVRVMEDKDSTPAEKLTALQDAAKHHIETTRRSMAGRGVDRHLFALYVVSVGKDVEAPFLKNALARPWHLSTSQQPQQQTSLWDLRRPEDASWISPGGGFGPVTDDGYGVSYMVASEVELFFHVSAKRSADNTSAERFIGRIFDALREMQEVLSHALPGGDKAAAGASSGGKAKAT